jgi:hypothetical protein
MNLYIFQTVPLSINRSFSLYTQKWYTSYKFTDSLQARSGCSILVLLVSCQQTCMTYIISVCTVKNSRWWWTEELSEICTGSFRNKWDICACSWFYYKKFVTMYGHMNVKLHKYISTAVVGCQLIVHCLVIVQKLNIVYLQFFDVLCNTSFKEHLPEDGQSRWPKHVAGYPVYNTINLHISICNCWSCFS